MAHSCCPQTKTPEALAKWIKENSIDTQTYEKKIELDEDTTHELEKASSLASRAIMRLDELKKEIMETLNDGTPMTVPADSLSDPERLPKDITIPPTKGFKELRKNLEFANKQLETGHKIENIEVFMIPWPEESEVVGVTIDGEEFFDDRDQSYTRQMTDDEVNNIKPMLKKEKKEKKSKKDDFMEEEEEAQTELDI
jgi:hypothetical protein